MVDLLVFFNIHSAAKLQNKKEGGTFAEFFCLKEVALCRKNEKNEKNIYRNFFSKFFEVSGKSHSTEKKVKKGPFGIFEHPYCCKILSSAHSFVCLHVHSKPIGEVIHSYHNN